MEESQKNGFEIYLLKPEAMGEAILVTMKENIQLSYKQSGSDTIDNFIYSSLAQNGYYRLNEILASNIEMKMLNSTQLASKRAQFVRGFLRQDWPRYGHSHKSDQPSQLPSGHQSIQPSLRKRLAY